MKILGHTRNGYLLSATKRELANLVGYYYEGEANCPRFDSGDEILIHKMYTQLRTLASKKHSLSSMQNTLREIIDLLEVHSPVIINIVEEKDNSGE